MREQVERERRKTKAREYLSRLVREYDVDAIMRAVVRPAIPPAPIPLDSPEAAEWAEVLWWAAAVTTERADVTALGVSDLPVACRGGWYPVREAVFGPGWAEGGPHDDLGADLDLYLRATKTPTAKKLLDRLVLPPGNPAWKTDREHSSLRQVLERS